MRGDWAIINRKIKECMRSSSPLDCLLKLFNITNDGWVAFKIGEYYETINQLGEAIKYYEKAYSLLPLDKYKALAESKINELQGKLNKPADELYIVSCTKRKIWDLDPNASKYVRAKDAYKGEHFIKWLNSSKSKNTFWIIFSSKYGLIEPDHPIENYDIHIMDKGAITDEMLLRQIMHYSFYNKKISDFKKIYFIGSPLYFEKIKNAFEMAGIEIEKYEINGINERIETYKQYLHEFLNQNLKHVKDLDKGNIPHESGIYAFYTSEGKPLYVGTSKDLRRRIGYHLTGNASNSTLRRKLIKNLKNEKAVTDFLENCTIRYLPLPDIEERKLKLLEHFFIAALNPDLND